jgi:hypothetical protein
MRFEQNRKLSNLVFDLREGQMGVLRRVKNCVWKTLSCGIMRSSNTFLRHYHCFLLWRKDIDECKECDRAAGAKFVSAERLSLLHSGPHHVKSLG